MSPRVNQLAYLVFEVSDLAAWEVFATEVLGLTIGHALQNGFALRMDSRALRFAVVEGPADDLACLGWEVQTAAVLEALGAELTRQGIDVQPGDDRQCQERAVERLLAFRDPAGIPCELLLNPAQSHPVASTAVTGGFVAEELGCGHAVISTRSMEESRRFYLETLGLRDSDRITCDLFGYPVDIAFFHANARHHSLAFGGPQDKRIHHFMLEVRDLEDVGLAFDRTLRHGLRIANTIGRHPNDRMISFYAHTPSGFQFEMGWNGRLIDDATWEPTTYDRISDWGHHPPAVLRPPRKETRS